MADYNGYPPTDAALIEARLENLLSAESQSTLGTTLLPAVQIQLHQLHRRLQAFATYQAEEAKLGWQIKYVEKDLERVVERADGDFRIFGRVDRIDVHPEHGYRILDYKTTESGPLPKKTHCRKTDDGFQWFDLQLPLYRRIANHLNIAEDDVSVGYVLLPKDTQNVGIAIADWDAEAFASAYAAADAVIDKLRNQIFWPPNPDGPQFADGLESICLDRSMDRNAVIAKNDAPPLYWPPLNPESLWQLWPGWEVRRDR